MRFTVSGLAQGVKGNAEPPKSQKVKKSIRQKRVADVGLPDMRVSRRRPLEALFLAF
jgi:hypothetical protein